MLGFRAWRVAKPTRQLVERAIPAPRVELPACTTLSPEQTAWLSERTKRRGPRFMQVQPDYEPGTLLPVTHNAAYMRNGAELAWSQPGLVRFACPLSQHPHSQPHRDCRCGLYAHLAVDTLATRFEGKEAGDYVLGAVIAWGHIVIHGIDGFRAEYARIVALSPPPALAGQWARKAAERLGVPFVPLDRLEQVGHEFGSPIRWRYEFE